MKIAIIGYSRSGKSTLAKILSKHYNIPSLHLDTIKFLPNWIERDRNEGRMMVLEFMKNNSWIIDGNHQDFFQKDRLKQADNIIFMNFPRRICFYRAFIRYLKNKNKAREDMAKGCIEKFDFEFAWWIIYEGRNKERKNHYKEIEKEFRDKVIVLKSPKDVGMFLKGIRYYG